ncbi:MAG: ribonuclease P [Candidatus Micrarchaeota archaeon]|nr:ribonuclease P [Candidatus Micrarchaeota archaeon]
MPKNSKLVERIARERIERLFELSTEMFNENSAESRKLGRRYVKLMLLIGSHYKVKIGKRISDSICKRCGNLLIPGITCTVRISAKEGYALYRCECGHESRAYLGKGSLRT